MRDAQLSALSSPLSFSSASLSACCFISAAALLLWSRDTTPAAHSYTSTAMTTYRIRHGRARCGQRGQHGTTLARPPTCSTAAPPPPCRPSVVCECECECRGCSTRPWPRIAAMNMEHKPRRAGSATPIGPPRRGVSGLGCQMPSITIFTPHVHPPPPTAAKPLLNHAAPGADRTTHTYLYVLSSGVASPGPPRRRHGSPPGRLPTRQLLAHF